MIRPRFARTLAGRADLQEAFRGSDIVVAADLIVVMGGLLVIEDQPTCRSQPALEDS